MKSLAFYLMVSLLTFTTFACNSETKPTKKGETSIFTEKIEVYYFHFTRRCITCNAVESVTKETIREYFSKDVKSGKITFKSINLDDATGQTFAKKMEVSGQTLLFVSNKESINLTTDAFMYAKNQPDKLKEKVKATIEKLKL